MIWKESRFDELDEILIDANDAQAKEGASISEEDFDRIREEYGDDE